MSNLERSTADLNPLADLQPQRSEANHASLLSDFWDDGFENESFENTEQESSRIKGFFKDSIKNTRSVSSREFDSSVSRKIQVGLYASDAQLLEELFIQSKKAGLSNVSRARILRVALRHFHTCWLNQDH
jgi:hypothetical protein